MLSTGFSVGVGVEVITSLSVGTGVLDGSTATDTSGLDDIVGNVLSLTIGVCEGILDSTGLLLWFSLLFEHEANIKIITIKKYFN